MEGGEPTADLERPTPLEADRRQRFGALEHIWAAFEDVPPAEIEAEVARAIIQARDAHRPAPGGASNATP